MRWSIAMIAAFIDDSPIVAGLVGAVLLIIFVFLIAATFSSSELIELKSADWICTASHQQSTITPIVVGKNVMAIPGTDTVCDQYTRSRRPK